MSKKGLRLLSVLKELKGHSFFGISNKEIAENLGLNAVDVSRDLADLIEAGLAIRLDNGRYAHSVQMLQIAQSYTNQVANLHAQINETNQRIMAGIME